MKTIAKLIVALSLCIAVPGCETLSTWQANPNVQFAETMALKLAQSYFSNGGNIDSAWSISNGINLIADVGSFAIQQRQVKDAAAANALAASKLKAQVKSFASDQKAVTGLADGLAAVVTVANAKTPEERSKVTLAIAEAIQKVAGQEMP